MNYLGENSGGEEPYSNSKKVEEIRELEEKICSIGTSATDPVMKMGEIAKREEYKFPLKQVEKFLNNLQETSEKYNKVSEKIDELINLYEEEIQKN